MGISLKEGGLALVKWRRLAAGLRTLALVFSVVVTVSVGTFIATHYHEVEQIVQVVSLLKSQSLSNPTTSQILHGALSGMVQSLNDPYSVYLEPSAYQQLKAQVSGNYGGVGLVIDMREGVLEVVLPFPKTPAYRAGIKKGDLIVKIGDQQTAGMDLEKAAELLKGPPGSQVTVSVQRPGETRLRDFVLTREVIQIPTVESKLLPRPLPIGYVRLTMFSDHTGQELGQALNELRQQGAKAIVLDLRNNPGGSLRAAVEVASYFIPRGPVVHLEYRARKETYEALGNYLQLPLAVLINRTSASASEIVAGAIKDNGTGTLIGERTFGKGLVQTLFEIDSQAAVKLTTARYLTPKGHDINSKGIEPDITIKLDAQTEERILAHSPDLGHDPQLQKAVEVVSRKAA